jgi:aspartokinase
VVRDDEAPDGPKSVAFRDGILFIRIASDKLEGVCSMLGKVSGALFARRIPVTMAKATESEVYLVIPEEWDGLEDALDEIAAWASVTVYRDKAFISVVGRNITSSEGLGDKVISVAGKVHLADVGANLMSESFVIDRERLQPTLEAVHGFIFKDS